MYSVFHRPLRLHSYLYGMFWNRYVVATVRICNCSKYCVHVYWTLTRYSPFSRIFEDSIVACSFLVMVMLALLQVCMTYMSNHGLIHTVYIMYDLCVLLQWLIIFIAQAVCLECIYKCAQPSTKTDSI